MTCFGEDRSLGVSAVSMIRTYRSIGTNFWRSVEKNEELVQFFDGKRSFRRLPAFFFLLYNIY